MSDSLYCHAESSQIISGHGGSSNPVISPSNVRALYVFVLFKNILAPNRTLQVFQVLTQLTLALSLLAPLRWA